jgi:hypothetical protein
MSKSIIPEVIEAAQNRRSFVRKIGLATAAAGALSIVNPKAEAQTATDITVLNFALNLEYLESEFYTYATTGSGIESQGIGISGTANPPNPTSGGTTTGGSQVTFSNGLLFSSQLAQEIATDERAHVTLLRSVLGGNAIARPNIYLGALGFGFGSQNDFIKLARIFEDIGITAYAGSSNQLSSAVIQTAARILATEAEHAAGLRLQCARLNIQTAPPLDGVDILPPPSGSQSTYFSVNPSNGLVSVRTPGQVLYLAFGNMANVTSGGFFPTGVNGAITMSSNHA